MITVMLADDNRYALKYFSQLVDWEKLGFSLVETAIDGNEAWEKFCVSLPEVVITDVQMPGKDGCEVAYLIKQKRPETLVVFLSSYNEFDYARAALNLDVYDYILKQEMDEDTFAQKLTEIGSFLQKRREKEKKNYREHLTACFSTPLGELDREFYKKSLLGNYIFLIIEQDHIPEKLARVLQKETPEADCHRMKEKIRQAIPQVEYIVRCASYRWACFCENGAELKQLIGSIKLCLMENFEQLFSVIVFGSNRSVLRCRIEYEEHLFLFNRRFFEGDERIMYAELYEQPSAQKKPETIDLRAFVRSFSIGDTPGAVYELQRIYRQLLHDGNLDQLVNTVERMLKVLQEASVEMAEEGGIGEWQEENQFTSARGTLRCVQQKVEHQLKWKELDSAYHSKALARAIRVIHNKYQDPALSVEVIAEKAGISVNRLNELFKTERQTTAGKYLTKVRMEQAKTLIHAGVENIAEISQSTGYNSQAYFARVYRKYYGVSPMEDKKERMR